jgi:hypothetical protein
MAKRSRTYAPPPGALAPLRNTRLYGGRDEQVEGNALRSRGCPNPDRAAVYTARPKRPVKTASPVAAPSSPRAFARKVEKARMAMEEAQRAVKLARERGQDTTAAAQMARTRRAAYLALAGGMPVGRPIELAQASDANKVKAAA